MDRTTRIAVWCAVLVFGIVLIRTAWLCDDAYITFRTVRNFVEGDGLRWNLVERVQTYTHPSWMFVLSFGYLVTGDIYYTSLVISIVVSLAAVIVIVRNVAPTPIAGVTCVSILVSSRSFVDYSTSGLENPLTHLLLAWLVVEYFRGAPARATRDLTRLSLIAALCVVNRFDTIVLAFPLITAVWWPIRSWRSAMAVALGFAPFIAWEIFSLIYYGFPFPNTAYAKLPEAIDLGSRVIKGLGYLASCARFDPIVALTIVAAIAVPLVRRKRHLYPLVASIAMYLAYVVYVGGDFMAGRFLTAPLVLSLCILVRTIELPARPRFRFIPASGALAIGLVLGARASLVSGGDYGMKWPWEDNVDSRGVSDERGIYYKFTGLIREGARFEAPRHRWFDEGARVRPGNVHVAATVGFIGWGAPRDAIIIDQLALGDPLLARLPPKNPRRWRPGHIDRSIPAGYIETRRSGRNVIVNRWIAAYYNDVALVTQGPIWSGERFAAIWRLNTGGADEMLEHAFD